MPDSSRVWPLAAAASPSERERFWGRARGRVSSVQADEGLLKRKTHKEVHAKRNDIEAAQKGHGVGPAGGVEAVEEDDGGEQGRRGEADKVARVDDAEFRVKGAKSQL